VICYREKEVIGDTGYWIKDKVALNDSQVAVFFYDDYKIKTGSESPSGCLPPASVGMTKPSLLSLPRRRESSCISADLTKKSLLRNISIKLRWLG
jgi:hypothetical protein